MISAIEPCITKLIHEAPHLDSTTVDKLQAALGDMGTPLARSIARIVDFLAQGRVDPGVALPALAEACAALVSSSTEAVLRAAQYQVDTLEPKPALVQLRKR